MIEIASNEDSGANVSEATARKQSTWPRRLAVTLIPLCVQLISVLVLFEWAGGKGSGRGLIGLGLVLVMALAIPVSLIANLWIVKETRHWNVWLVLLVAIVQAILIPLGIIVTFVLGAT